MKITTQNNENSQVRRKEIKNWYDVGLNKKSYLRIESPIKIEKEQLIRKIGKVNKYDLYLYLNELTEYFNKDIIEKLIMK